MWGKVIDGKAIVQPYSDTAPVQRYCTSTAILHQYSDIAPVQRW